MKQDAALLIFMGLLLNGCFQANNRSAVNIDEERIVDERELGDALREAACLYSGRNWTVFDKCE